MKNNNELKIKSIEELDMAKYEENQLGKNPYEKKYLPK